MFSTYYIPIEDWIKSWKLGLLFNKNWQEYEYKASIEEFTVCEDKTSFYFQKS